jgi:signal transduction histidine kinase
MKNAYELREEYTSALQAYLVKRDEAALSKAYELGREALASGMGVLDMAAAQSQGLLSILSRYNIAEEEAKALEAAESFRVEALTPFEMTHRGFREANFALYRMNERLEDALKRIAHQLHDEAGQLLAAVHIAVEEVARELPPPSRENLRKVNDLLDQIEEQLRHLSHELRPSILDDLGLLPALEFLCAGVSKRTGVPITVEGSTAERLLPGIEIAVYRIAQEALNNVTKHAHATRVVMQLERGAQTLHCNICDDGVGFDVRATLARRGERGLGLMGITERLNALGGKMAIISSPGNGTKLQVTIPLEKKDADSSSFSR